MTTIKKIALATTAVAVMAGTVSAVDFTVNGDIQFRLREETNIKLDSTNKYYEDETTHIYANKYAWNIKLGVDVNENLAMKFRVSNPNGSGLETVDNNQATNEVFTAADSAVTTAKHNVPLLAPSNGQFVAIPQAEIQYKTGSFCLSAGMIEVKNNTALTLAASAEAGGYQKTINTSSSWGVYANSSQAGLKAGWKFNDMVGLSVVSAIAEANYAKGTTHYTDFRTIVEAPLKFGDFKVTPVVSIRSGVTGDHLNRTYNYNGSVDFSGKFSKMLSLNAGFGYGQFIDADAKAGDWEKPAGLLATIKPTVKFGINKVSLGYSLGSAWDLLNEDKDAPTNYYQHIDLKWGVSVADNFTIMPRYRTWVTTYSDGSDGKLRLRPEIILVGKF